MKRNVILTICIFFMTMCGLIFLAYSVYQQADEDAKKPFEITLMNNENFVDQKRGVSIEVTVSKSWEDRYFGVVSWGAEYDGVITNNNTYPIMDWNMEIKTPVFTPRIDSSWNGEYSVGKEFITARPDEETTLIPPGESKTFGFVMYSPKIYEMNEFTFTAYAQRQLEEYPLFWVVGVGTFIWLIALISTIIVAISMRGARIRKKKDEEIISQTMETFAGLIDAKDEYTRGHSVRVAHYSTLIGKKLKLKEDELRNLGYIALMHDCGKIGVPDAVLNKPARLLPEEFKIIASHTEVGGKILENFSAIPGIKEGALYHHERYDGKGYPEGIKGDAIPLYARIICVADSFDAMNSDRCYRKHLPREVILAELEKCAGAQFDPKLSRIMYELVESGVVKIGDNTVSVPVEPAKK
ncbi:MAG: HD domain-containing protein [Lachnospiraceae bacterium]|nr:HD domain-containing protein [Candidatus Merdinaster equi]